MIICSRTQSALAFDRRACVAYGRQLDPSGDVGEACLLPGFHECAPYLRAFNEV